MLHRNSKVPLSKHEITKSVLTMMKSRLPVAYPTYNDFPQELKEQWLRTFWQDFNWDVHLVSEVRKAFHQQAATTYGKNLYAWKTKWMCNSPYPSFGCNPNGYKKFCEY